MIWLWLLWMFVVAASCLGFFWVFLRLFKMRPTISRSFCLDPCKCTWIQKLPWEATLYTKKYKIVWIYCFLDPPRGAKWMGEGAIKQPLSDSTPPIGGYWFEFVYLMYFLHANRDAYIHACITTLLMSILNWCTTSVWKSDWRYNIYKKNRAQMVWVPFYCDIVIAHFSTLFGTIGAWSSHTSYYASISLSMPSIL